MRNPLSPITSKITGIFLQHRVGLRKFLARYLRNDMDLDDVLQDAYLKAYDREKKGDSITNPKAFLFAVARNLALNEVDRQARRINDIIDDCLPEDYPDQLTTAAADLQAEAHQTLGLYCEAVATLPPKCRQVYLLRKVQGLSHQEIAEHMGISRAAVEKQLVRGMSRCREYLETAKNGQGRIHGETGAVISLSKDQDIG